MKIPQDMITGTRHSTTKCGVLAVIKYHNSKCVDVEFEATGFIATSTSHDIRRGYVTDKLLIPDGYKPGTVYSTKFNGDLEIVKYNDARSIEVRFILTGYTTVRAKKEIESGKIKDPFFPRVQGVGFYGVGEYNTCNSELIQLAHTKWSDMLRRCYSKNSLNVRPTYAGCTVDPKWHNFQNFAGWFVDNYPDDGVSYELDKDIKVKGNKVYGPDTCLLVTHNENSVAAFSKTHTFRNPSGEVVTIENLTQFCRDNNLNTTSFHQLKTEKIKTYKGWTKV
ncbi:hypothetical protein NVP1164O_01 [Vibrio phage 1.164.O._10N.261.51.A7]|nr:hypothetical protein NVP1164O_01 [Vibrio phage 1.164.O._10N.261.51.A7]